MTRRTAQSVVDVIAGEALYGDYEDMQAVAAAIMNRADALGVSPMQVVQNQNEFNAYGKSLPKGNGNEQNINMARTALASQREPANRVHDAIFYSTPKTRGNLPEIAQKAEVVHRTNGHVFSGSLNDPVIYNSDVRIGTANGYKQVANFNPMHDPLPETGPKPTPREIGMFMADPFTAAMGAPFDDIEYGVDVPGSAAVRDFQMRGNDVPEIGVSNNNWTDIPGDPFADFSYESLRAEQDKLAQKAISLPPGVGIEMKDGKMGFTYSNPAQRAAVSADISRVMDEDLPGLDMTGLMAPSAVTNPAEAHRRAAGALDEMQMTQQQYNSAARGMIEAFGSAPPVIDALPHTDTGRMNPRSKDYNPNSKHFEGTSLDISTRGMTNEQKQVMISELRSNGFTSFGFGENSVHAARDGRNAVWGYGAYGNPRTGTTTNKEWAGIPVSEWESHLTAQTNTMPQAVIDTQNRMGNPGVGVPTQRPSDLGAPADLLAGDPMSLSPTPDFVTANAYNDYARTMAQGGMVNQAKYSPEMGPPAPDYPSAEEMLASVGPKPAATRSASVTAPAPAPAAPAFAMGGRAEYNDLPTEVLSGPTKAASVTAPVPTRVQVTEKAIPPMDPAVEVVSLPEPYEVKQAAQKQVPIEEKMNPLTGLTPSKEKRLDEMIGVIAAGEKIGKIDWIDDLHLGDFQFGGKPTDRIGAFFDGLTGGGRGGTMAPSGGGNYGGGSGGGMYGGSSPSITSNAGVTGPQTGFAGGYATNDPSVGGVGGRFES